MQRPNPRSNQALPRSELSAALASCRGAFLGTGLISGMSNILTLAGAMFMLEIYDRVLPSRSMPTLVGLVILVAGLFAALGILDAIRGRILARIGGVLDETLSGRVYDTLVRLPLLAGNRGDGLQPLRDLDAIRSYLSSLGPVALFDLPWIPLYLGICFAFHPLIGITALVGAIILIGLTVLTEMLMRDPTKAATEAAVSRNALAETSRRNAEALTAMGMVGRIAERWGEANRQYMRNQRRASDVGGGLGSISKVLRMLLQSGVLAVGAYLVIHQEATAGIIIAGSILSARALAPVDLAIANWKGFVAARQSWTQAEPPFVGAARARRAHGARCAQAQPGGRERERGAARHAKGGRSGRHLQTRGRAGSRHHRTERLRQVVAGAACWSGSGTPRAARCASMAPRSINGRRTRSAATSAICRRTWNC